MENQRNFILAVVLSLIVLLGWGAISQRFFPVANPPATRIVNGKQVPLSQPMDSPGGITPGAVRARDVVLKETPRIAIRTPKLDGSINLKGARIDDLVLSSYKESIAKNSPPIRLLSPAGAADSYYAGFGWTGDGVDAPGPNTVWTTDKTVLTPASPVALSWTNQHGQRFETDIAVDNDYMFTVTQKIANPGTGPVAVRPYGLVSRNGVSKDPYSWTNRVGPIVKLADHPVDFIKAKDLDAAGTTGIRYSTQGGWLGFSDKYWLTAIVPDAGAQIETGFLTPTAQVYEAVETGKPMIVGPGKAISVSEHFFAGAKEVNLLDNYEKSLGIEQFGRAIDWGWYRVIEKPIFWLLDQMFRFVGNFGVAIIMLTVLVRGSMFPIAQRQFRSMAGMRRVQPKMKELQERHKDDKQRLQQEMLKLYQEEKVNPLAGCLPILIQIPIFYALYKVLMVTIEMRHQPFILWIKDLSAPDPLHVLNLFGLLPFTPPSFLGIGVLAILLGITMWLQFRLNPQPMEPAQQQVMSMMPWVMMFIMAPFAAGLLVYWITSNFLTIAQQTWLYRQNPIMKTPAAATASSGKK